MKQHMHAALVEGKQLEFEDEGSKLAWGRIFHIMSNLQRLTITFETSEDKAEEMESIVEWAHTWRFETMGWRHWMTNDHSDLKAYLVADQSVKKMSWRGLAYQWSSYCPTCGTCAIYPKMECTYCQKREILQRDGKGPRLLQWTMTWRAQPVT